MIKPLITNKDIKAINNKSNKEGCLTPDESTLIREHQLSESQIQIACVNIIKVRYGNLKDASVIFQQNDNGGYYSTMQNPYYEAAARKKKKRMGTLTGWEDGTIWMYKKEMILDLNEDPYKYSKGHIFVEVKRIGSSSQIEASENQKFWHNYHKEWNDSTHLFNNTIYFNKVICAEIDNFLNITS